MGSVGIDSYRNGTKNNVRGWTWNRIAHRIVVTGNRTRDAVVLSRWSRDDRRA